MSTATAGLTATCDRIRSLAADLGIDLRVVQFDYLADRGEVLVEVHVDSMDEFNDVCALGSYEFGCGWDRAGPHSSPLAYLRFLVGRLEHATLTVPVSDLDELLTCFQSATGNILAKGRREPSRRRFEWIAIFALAVVAGVVTASTGHYNLAYIAVLIAAFGTFGAEVAEGDLAVLDRLTTGRVPG